MTLQRLPPAGEVWISKRYVLLLTAARFIISEYISSESGTRQYLILRRPDRWCCCCSLLFYKHFACFKIINIFTSLGTWTNFLTVFCASTRKEWDPLNKKNNSDQSKFIYSHQVTLPFCAWRLLLSFSVTGFFIFRSLYVSDKNT
jgi:hypothetical protein